METMKVKEPGHPLGYKIINKEDFNADEHKPYKGEAKPTAEAVGADGLTAEESAQLATLQAKQRDAQANRGVVTGAGPGDDGRNTSGTYSEPTPSDIRYPDKSKTEFENNQGAFIDKSAAGMREERGLPDAPGGLAPAAAIPDNWPTLHWQKKVALARDIKGDPKAEFSATEAHDAIEAEMNRRAAATSTQQRAPPAPPPAGTTGPGTSTAP
jgi:hypothetical protein